MALRGRRTDTAAFSMKPPDEVRRNLVRQWLEKADQDLEAAVVLGSQASPLGRIVGFHCQQAVEKYLKALFVRHQIELPKTHDLERLLAAVRPVAATVADALLEVPWLTPYGVELRYPGDLPDALPGDDERAISLARLTRRIVIAALAP